jgi:hypothetical protein
MRTFGVTCLAATMFVSSAFAATDAPVGHLTPGKPAGVQQAQIEAGGVLLVISILVLAGGIALIASQTQGTSTCVSGTAA